MFSLWSNDVDNDEPMLNSMIASFPGFFEAGRRELGERKRESDRVPGRENHSSRSYPFDEKRQK